MRYARPTEIASGLFNPPYLGLEGNSLCPSLESVEQVGGDPAGYTNGPGKDATSSTSTTRLRRSDVIWKAPTATPGNTLDTSPGRSVGNSGSGSSDAQDITSTTTWNLWVDSNGQLVRTKVVSTITPADDGPPPQSVFDSRISGYGEANTITAPWCPVNERLGRVCAGRRSPAGAPARAGGRWLGTGDG